MPERLDKEMLSRGIVKTRSQARMLIEQGDVQVNSLPAKKPGMPVKESDKIEVMDRTLYVGRGAYKLEKAIEEFKLNFNNLIVADIGASTGGFTQLCLDNGANKVYAVDVGRDQLAQILREDERVINMEGVNAKYPIEIDEKIDAFVMDVSFISIKLILNNVIEILKDSGFGVVLVKPQFEAGPERVGKGGIIKEEHRKVILEEVLDWFEQNSIKAEKVIESPITGKTGNVEYLALVRKA